MGLSVGSHGLSSHTHTIKGVLYFDLTHSHNDPHTVNYHVIYDNYTQEFLAKTSIKSKVMHNLFVILECFEDYTTSL